VSEHGVRARPPRGEERLPPRHDDPSAWLLDAAYSPGGRADDVYLPHTEAEVAAVLRAHGAVLTVGAQSSLTGGATPHGEAVVATTALDALEIDADARVARCGAGVPLVRIQEASREHGLFLAPAPTYDGAFVGGAIATNAAGAATFKYGTMRDAVRAVTVVLADGSVLDLERGAVSAHPDGWFDVVRRDGTTVRVPVPTYAMPDVPKCSAGYFAARGMDLVDLFVGSEGTLGIVTSAVLDLATAPAAKLTCWLPLQDEAVGLELAGRLRDASRSTWADRDPNGIDVPAIEHMDRRCIELLLEDGMHRKHGVPLDARDAMVLLFHLAFPAPLGAEEAMDQIAEPEGRDAPLPRLLRLLGEPGERLEAALPGETSVAERFGAMREAVPMCVNHRIRDVHLADGRVHKVAGDFVVPFGRFAEALDGYRTAFRARGLDHAIWGHISDGNVHPNVLPRDYADVAAAKEALLEIGDRVVAWGGSPLAEHGVGRNDVKQALLVRLYGEEGIAEMRAVKRALDPAGVLAPGVLFPVAVPE
jgi:D-lactate dehydrogenase (cytochrome)